MIKTEILSKIMMLQEHHKRIHKEVNMSRQHQNAWYSQKAQAERQQYLKDKREDEREETQKYLEDQYKQEQEFRFIMGTEECCIEQTDTSSTNPKDLEGNKKPPLSLIPGSALIYMAEAFKEGARKYGAYNWRTKKVQAMVYLDAVLRHTLALIDGEDIDPESGKPHLAGLLASAAVYVDAKETGNLIDNRPTKGTAGRMIRKIGGKGDIDVQ